MNNLSYQKDYWKNFISSSEKDVLAKDLNVHWNKETQSYFKATEIPKEYLQQITDNGKLKKVLDFGVGLGRNQSYLNSIAEEVHGFDLPEMIEKYKQIQKDNNLLFNQIQNIHNDYSVVYECTVFQHMPPQEVLFSLMSLSYRSKFLISYSRTYNDFCRDFNNKKGGLNMYHIFASCIDYWDIMYYSDENASLINSEDHFYTLLKSKNA